MAVADVIVVTTEAIVVAKAVRALPRPQTSKSTDYTQRLK
jgi:hypothetical protein